jgi:hypothetical protein
MGAIMFLTGWHDTVAGTTIVRVADATAWGQWRAGSVTSLPDVPRPRPMAAWKIAMAVLVHLFFTMVYMIFSAI